MNYLMLSYNWPVNHYMNQGRGAIKTLLMYAAECGTAELVRNLLSEDECDLLAKDQYGRTALHYACKAGNLATVEELLRFV